MGHHSVKEERIASKTLLAARGFKEDGKNLETDPLFAQPRQRGSV